MVVVIRSADVAGKMRPGVRLAMQNASRTRHHGFAGQDREATERARSYFEGQPPTSPAMLFARWKLVCLMQRFVIEGATAQLIGQEQHVPSMSIAALRRPRNRSI